MKNEFYVYAYLRKDKTPYYVGKGKEGRAYSKDRVIKPPKDKSRIVFLRKGLTEDKAFEWERFYIKHYGRIDTGTGILHNLTDGGEGNSNPSEETREKMRKNKKKKIELTRMSDGEIFIFDSARNAARALNLNESSLASVCRGKGFSVGGFLARYWTPDIEGWGEGLFHLAEEVKQQRTTNYKEGKKSRLKKIELIRISDGAALVFDGVVEAAAALNLSRSNLSEICHGKKKTCKGYTARYLESSAG
jgi:hypothetical protein